MTDLNLKRRSDKVMEKKTWQEFLSTCDASVLRWDSLDSLEVVGKDGTTCTVQISIHDYLADHEAFEYNWKEGKIRWNKGEWTEIVNYDDDPAIYLKVYKQGNIYRTDGRFYFDKSEAMEEKEKRTDCDSTDTLINEPSEPVKLLNSTNESITHLTKFFKAEIVLIPLLGYTKGNTETEKEKRYKAAKKPIANNWNDENYKGLTGEEVEKHIEKGGWLGLKIPKGMILIDVDEEQTGEYLYKVLGELGLNYHAIKTPRGWQFFFKDTGQVKSQLVGALTKSLIVVDYKLSEKGYTVLPDPTRNTEGRYWEHIADGELSPLPVFLEPVKIAKPEDVVEIPIPEGKRDDTLFRHVSRLRDFISDEDEIRKIMYFINQYLTKPPLEKEHLETLIKKRDGYEYGHSVSIEKLQDDDKPRMTDTWNAKQFSNMFQGKILWCDPWNTWLIFKEGRWQRDDELKTVDLAKQVAKSMYERASQIDDDNERKAFVKWTLRTESRQALMNMIELAKPDLSVRPELLDVDKYLLNLRNGTYDLRNDKLLSHSPEDRLTMMANVEYDPDAKCPKWIEFLNKIFAGDQDLIGFVQKALGYSLTGDTGEDCFFIVYGTGANGKTTFLNTIETVLGDYAAQSRAETFLSKDRDTIPSDLARLKGRRFVVATEFPQGKVIAESLIKSLTGRDELTVRELFGKWFQYKPQFKIWLGTNHKPVVRDNSVGFWRRVKLIPFEVQIPVNERIRNFEDILLEEASGILNWMLEGYREWKNEGLGDTEKIREATAEYRDENDVLRDFLEERCIEDPNASISKKELYQAYVDWSTFNTEKTLSKGTFLRLIEERGYKPYRSNKERGWKGITLKKEQ